MAANVLAIAPLLSLSTWDTKRPSESHSRRTCYFFQSSSASGLRFPSINVCESIGPRYGSLVLACLSSSSSGSSPKSTATASTRLYVSGLSFRTTEEGLRNAFQNFGQLIDVNLVMDKIANRPRGFAFLRYATEEEGRKAIEGMHGKFLDGRVIFVEVAKPRSELRQAPRQNERQY